jgi:hypothetical protein
VIAVHLYRLVPYSGRAAKWRESSVAWARKCVSAWAWFSFWILLDLANICRLRICSRTSKPALQVTSFQNDYVWIRMLWSSRILQLSLTENKSDYVRPVLKKRLSTVRQGVSSCWQRNMHVSECKKTVSGVQWNSGWLDKTTWQHDDNMGLLIIKC